MINIKNDRKDKQQHLFLDQNLLFWNRKDVSSSDIKHVGKRRGAETNIPAEVEKKKNEIVEIKKDKGRI